MTLSFPKIRLTASTRTFILITAFLNLAGIGIINPVYPFIVQKYVAPPDQATVIAMLFSSYAFFQFFFVPLLGALSDRFGRRPVLLISLVGSAFGYFIFGIGGSLAILFLGRIIDGITGGNLAAIYAFAADITEPKDRTRFFGVIGAVSGLGFVVGPALGGLLYSITGIYESPVYFAAIVTLLNTVWGVSVMPESLPQSKRQKVEARRLNPFTQLFSALTLPQTRLLLTAVFIWAVAFALLQANLGQMLKDVFRWDVSQTSVIFFIVGVMGIITQGVLIRRLLPRFGEGRLAIAGLVIQAGGFALTSFTILLRVEFLVYFCPIFVAVGNGLIIPAITGLMSSAVSAQEQGKVQGGNQSVQALGRVVGPIAVPSSYAVSPAGPYMLGTVGLLVAALFAAASLPVLTAYKKKHPPAS